VRTVLTAFSETLNRDAQFANANPDVE
jgi:hypothetical protein